MGVFLMGVSLMSVSHRRVLDVARRSLQLGACWEPGVTYKDTGVCRSTCWSPLKPEAIWI
jgi:hypothetical protein